MAPDDPGNPLTNPIDVRRAFVRREASTGILKRDIGEGDVRSWRPQEIARVGNAAHEPTKFGKLS